MLDGDGVARVQDHRRGALRRGDGVEHVLPLQSEEVVGVPLQHGGADLGDHAAGLGLGQLLGGGDAALRQELDILLLALADGAAGGHNLVLGHIDHGVALHQVGVVLQGDEVGGLPGDVEQQGKCALIAQILHLALGGGLGGVLRGAGGVVELGLLGALVGQQEAQVGLVGVGGGDAGVHIHVVVEGNVVVPLGGDGHVPLAKDGIDEAVDIGAVVVVLLHDQLRGEHVVHPGGDFGELTIGALTGDGVA